MKKTRFSTKAKETIVIFTMCIIIPILSIIFIGCTNSLSTAFKQASEMEIVSDEPDVFWPNGNVIIYKGEENE